MIHHSLRLPSATVCLLVAGMSFNSAGAVQIVIDYTYDTNNFFPTGSTQRSTMNAAAGFFTNLLQNNFSAIQTPDPLVSQFFDGVYSWEWSLNFNHPGNGSLVTLNNPIIAENEFRVYVGGSSLSGNTLGLGGPGGFGWAADSNGGFFTQEEVDQINITTDTFQNAVENRNQPTGFTRWGGMITFDNDASTLWHFDASNLPTSGTSDFLSVALHELGHTLGLGASDDWFNLTGLINNSPRFLGAQAQSAHGGPVPLEGDRVHWLNGLFSTVWGTGVPQEAAMDPTLTQGDRKLFTTLDVNALADLGWVVPEPAMFSLLMLGSSMLIVTRRRAA